jgi:hypothetical protein
MNFPKIPPSKTFGQQMTPEQEVLMKLLNGQPVDKKDEDILREALEFYKEAFAFLTSVDLTNLNDGDATILIDFLNKALPMEVFNHNEIHFQDLYRVSYVRDNFLEDCRVKDLKYLRQPPEDVIRNLGIYGRANSPNSTVFYAAFKPGSAVLETKPCVGQKIILAHWVKDPAIKFNSYPITNNKTIDNESLKSATGAFQKLLTTVHPLFAEILDRYMEFISSEFVKDIPVKHLKKYEYLYSAFFADRVLKNSFTKMPGNDMAPFDCIIYPSIAAKYSSANLAIIPDSVPKLRPVHLEESIVLSTRYTDLNYPDNQLPIGRQIIRTATKFDGDRITWSDE